jgi:hypothetical protein
LAIPPAPNWAVFSAECSAVIGLFAQLRDLDEIATEQDQCKKTPQLTFSNPMPIFRSIFQSKLIARKWSVRVRHDQFFTLYPAMCRKQLQHCEQSKYWRSCLASNKTTMSLCAFLFVYL